MVVDCRHVDLFRRQSFKPKSKVVPLKLVSRILRVSGREAEHRTVHHIEMLLTLIAVEPEAAGERLLAALLQAGVNLRVPGDS